jgi:uncharacterized protein with HEPN domain
MQSAKRRNRKRAKDIYLPAPEARSIPEDLKIKHPLIPWRSIADFGNRLRHAYHDVDSQIVWKIVHQDLDNLRSAVLLLKAQLGEKRK